MKATAILSTGLCCVLSAAATAQSGPAAPAPANMQSAAQGRPAGQPVSYASMTQLNGMLEKLEASSKSTQSDLTRLRIERWKTDNGTKKQSLANIDSIQRNLSGALPEIIAQLRNAPEDVPATFKLYRNLDALYDVLGSVVEATGAFGSKDDLQALSNDLSSFESTRRQLGERIDTLATSKEAELVRLRTDLKTLQAAAEAAPPKKIVVDDTEPPKKPTPKKKTPAKSSTTTKPPAGQNAGTQPPSTPKSQ